MTRFTPLVLLALALPGSLSAQSGTIAYDRADRLDFELPPELKNNPRFAEMPNSRVTPVVLYFTPAATLQARPETAEGPGGTEVRTMTIRGGDISIGQMKAVEGMFVARAGGAAGGRAGQGEILASYTDLEAGIVTETRKFLGRTFRFSEPRSTLRWKLTTEQSLFLDHPVMKATVEHEGEQIEAWFTPDIPISGGPEGYGGLPGMILTLNVNDGERTYTATAVTLGEPPVEMKAPTDGSEVTREEFEKIVADKMAELEKTRGRRRGGDAVMIIKQDG